MSELQFILDQITRQQSEFRKEVKEEFKTLRHVIEDKEKKTDNRLNVLEKFKWHISGGVIVLVFVLELAFRI